MSNNLLSTLFLASGLVMVGTATAGVVTVVNFEAATGQGLSQNRMQINNIRLDHQVDNPFDETRPEITSVLLNVPFTFDTESLHLVPNLESIDDGSAEACASLTLNINNAFNGEAIANASVVIGDISATTDASGQVSFTDLIETNTLVTVSATGFNTISQNINLSCDETTSLGIALSPSSGEGALEAGAFRVTVSWAEEPRDLDSHLTGPDDNSTGPDDESNRFHVYFAASSTDVAILDVDDTTSFGPETITVSPPSGSALLRPGLYRYSIHHFSGLNDISVSSATVRLTLPDGTERIFTPPPSNGSLVGSNDVWTVFEVTVNSSASNITVLPVNTYSNGTSAGSVRSRARTTTGFGEVENSIDWDNLPEK